MVLVNQGDVVREPVSDGGRVRPISSISRWGWWTGRASRSRGWTSCRTPAVVYRNRGDGTFERPQVIAVDEIYDSACNDLGDPDETAISTSCSSRSCRRVVALRNDGSGSSSDGQLPRRSGDTVRRQCDVADPDRDGRPTPSFPPSTPSASRRSRHPERGPRTDVSTAGARAPRLAAGELEAIGNSTSPARSDRIRRRFSSTDRRTPVSIWSPSREPGNFGPEPSNLWGRSGTSIPSAS